MTSNCHHGCSPSFISETTQDPLLSRHSSKGQVSARACPCAHLHFSGFKTVQTWNRTCRCSVEGAFTESTSSENQTSFSTRVVESPGQETRGNGRQKCSSVPGNAVGSASSITFPLRARGDGEMMPQLCPLGPAGPGLPREAGGREAGTDVIERD